MSTYSGVKQTKQKESGAGVQTVHSSGTVSLTNNTVGDISLDTSNNNLLVWNGSGWYKVGTITNATPSISSAGNDTYELEKDGTAVVVTITATDADGTGLTYAYSVTAGSLTNGGGVTATVTQGTGSNTNKFTITPTTNQSYGGTFSLTFTASDGVQSATSGASAFTLKFTTYTSNRTKFLLKTNSNTARNNHTIRTYTAPNGIDSTTTFGAVKFDSSGDYLKVNHNDFFAGTGDYCIEFWFRQDALQAAGLFHISDEFMSATTKGIAFNIDNNTGEMTGIDPVGAWDSNTDYKFMRIQAKRWYHYAMVKTGGRRRAYLDGYEVMNKADTYNNASYGHITIGGYYNNSNLWNGNISNFRYVVGSPVYNPSGFSATGNCTIFDGTGDYLTPAAHDDFNLGTEDFTIEAWVLPAATGGGVFQLSDTAGGFKTSTSGTLGLGISSGSSKWLLYGAGSAADITGDLHTPTLSKWYHIAICKSNAATGVSKLRMYINGVEMQQRSDTSNYNFNKLVIGGYYSTSYTWNGYISNFRIVKGKALYFHNNFIPPKTSLTNITGTTLLTCKNASGAPTDTSSNTHSITVSGDPTASALGPYNYSFSPPTSPLTAVTNTKLITCNSETAISDTGGSSHTITNAGDPVVSIGPNSHWVDVIGTPSQGTFSPYTPEGWWSCYVGKDDSNYSRIVTNSSTHYQIGTNDFCLEAWVWVNSVGRTPMGLLGTSSSSNGYDGNAAYPGLQLTTDHRLRCTGFSDTAGVMYINDINNQSTAIHKAEVRTFPMQQWVHVAMTRRTVGSSSCAMSVYINGKAQKIWSDGTPNTHGDSARTSHRPSTIANTTVGVGVYYSDSYWGDDFYVSNLRFDVGSPVYTADFTPSTTPLANTANTKLRAFYSNNWRKIDRSHGSWVLTHAGTNYDGRPASTPWSPFDGQVAADDAEEGIYNGSGSGSVTFNSNAIEKITITDPVAAAPPQTSDLTIEFWFYSRQVSSANSGYIIDHGSNNYAWLWHNNEHLRIYDGAGDIGYISDVDWKPYVNTWAHVALVRYYIDGSASDGWLFKTYVNGEEKDSTYSGVNSAHTSNYIQIGDGPGNGNPAATANPTKFFSIADYRMTHGLAHDAGGTTVFDGTGDYLSVANTYNLGTADWTIEFWAKWTNFDASRGVCQLGQDNGSLGIMSLTSGKLRLLSSYVASHVDTDYVLESDTWYHIALVNDDSANTQTFYINGVADTSTGSKSDAFTFTNTTTIIGGRWWGGAFQLPFIGEISNFRVVASKVYTGSFTPPTSALTNITNTKLLTCQNKTGAIADATSSPLTVTTVGNAVARPWGPLMSAPTSGLTTTSDTLLQMKFNNAGIYNAAGTTGNMITRGTVASSSTQKKFGTTSAWFPRASAEADYIQLNDMRAAEYQRADYGASIVSGLSDDWTIEFWVYPSSGRPNTACTLMGNYQQGGGTGDLAWYIGLTANNYIEMKGEATGTSQLLSGTTLTQCPNDTWTHIAIVGGLTTNKRHYGSNIACYKNGVLGEVTGAVNIPTNYHSLPWRPFIIGGRCDNNDQTIGASYDFRGYLEDIRISENAKYGKNTIPTPNLTAITNTKLLCFTKPNVIDDISLGTHTLSGFSGGVKPDCPFLDSWNLDPPSGVNHCAVLGGDAVSGNSFIDGNMANLGNHFTMGSGEWTVEFWFYHSSQPGSYVTYFANEGNIAIEWYSNTIKMWLTASGGSNWGMMNAVSLTTTDPAENAWHHLAVVRDNAAGKIRAWLNGVEEVSSIYTISGSIDPWNDTNGISMGTYYPGFTTDFPGMMSNLRVVKGDAVYTSNFTPSKALTKIAGTSCLLFTKDAPETDASDNHFPVQHWTGNTSNTTMAGFYSPTSGSVAHSSDSNTLGYAGPHADFTMGTGDFTVECWARMDDDEQNYLFQINSPANSVGSNTGAELAIGWEWDKGWTVVSPNASGNAVSRYSYVEYTHSTNDVLVGIWTHVAVARKSGLTTFYINGYPSLRWTDTYNYANTYVNWGNHGTSGALEGRISNFRLVKGTAVYECDFTPPTAELN